MTLKHWLASALVGLEAQARTRLEAEYTAHFHDALAATGNEALALAELGNPSELNRQLRRSYLTVEEARWIDRYVAELSRPAWAYGLVGVVVLFTAIQGEGWAGMWGMWLITALALSVRALAPRFTSPRRASLLVVAVVIPMQLVGLAGPLPQTLAQLLTGLINAVLFLSVMGLVFILPRLQVWRKVLGTAEPGSWQCLHNRSSPFRQAVHTVYLNRLDFRCTRVDSRPMLKRSDNSTGHVLPEGSPHSTRRGGFCSARWSVLSWYALGHARATSPA